MTSFPVTIRLQEAYTYSSDVTRHAIESGAILSDHVILQPIRIDLAFDVSNWENGHAEYALDLLESIWRERTPVDLQTEHKNLSNMVMTSLQGDNSAPQWGKLSFRASFQQLKLVSLQVSDFPESKVSPEEQTGGPATPKSSETKTDNGKQTPRTSALAGLFG